MNYALLRVRKVLSTLRLSSLIRRSQSAGIHATLLQTVPLGWTMILRLNYMLMTMLTGTILMIVMMVFLWWALLLFLSHLDREHVLSSQGAMIRRFFILDRESISALIDDLFESGWVLLLLGGDLILNGRWSNFNWILLLRWHLFSSLLGTILTLQIHNLRIIQSMIQ